MRGKPGYEHLNEPLHLIVEAELPVEIIDARLMQAREILEDLLKPVVILNPFPFSRNKKDKRVAVSLLVIYLLFKDAYRSSFSSSKCRMSVKIFTKSSS